MPRKRKSGAYRASNLDVAREVLSTKRRKSTPAESEVEAEMDDESDDLTVAEINLQDAMDQEGPSNTGSQINFRVAIKKGVLAPAPLVGSYFEWSIATDAADIDGPEESEERTATSEGLDENFNNSVDHEGDDSDTSSESDNEIGPETIDNTDGNTDGGKALDCQEAPSQPEFNSPLNQSPPANLISSALPPLKGYESMPFEPNPTNQHSADIHITPTCA